MMESDVSVIWRHHGRLSMLRRQISFVHQREHQVLTNVRELEVLYGKTQLKRVALDHCGAEITVELHPLDTKAKRQ